MVQFQYKTRDTLDGLSGITRSPPLPSVVTWTTVTNQVYCRVG